MNKKIIMAVVAMAAATFLGLIFSQNLSVAAGPDLTEKDVRDKVEAQYPGQITELELDEKGKNPVYEVEIEIEGKEYELLIDGNTGEVLKLDEKLVAKNEEASEPKQEEKSDVATSTKKEDDTVKIKEKVTVAPTTEEKEITSKEETKSDTQKTNKIVAAPKNTENESKKEVAQKPVEKPKEKAVEKKSEPKKQEKKTETKKSIISEQQAIEIALKQFSGKVEDIELDKDDGRLIYEIEIESNRGEADIEIDAYTGKVLLVDIDWEDDDDDDD